MRHDKIYAAYPVVKKLKGMSFPGTIAYRLHKLEKELKEVYDFQTEEHRKLFQQYNPQYDAETKQLTFGTPEDCRAFVKATDELDQLEHDIAVKPIRIPVNDKYELSGDDMETLEGIIEFYEEEPEPDIQIMPMTDAPSGSETIELSETKIE